MPRRPLAIDDSPLFRLVRLAWFWRGLLATLVLVVSWLALTPSPPHTLDTGWDKLNHMLAFTALAVSACFSGSVSPRRLVAAAALLLAFGGAIELLQMQVPGRDAEWADLLADGVGLAVGMLAALGLRRRATAAAR